MTDQLMTTELPCQFHGGHRPQPRVNHRHHVWPLGHGGPDVPENIVVICPTGHANIHRYLDLLLHHNGSVPPEQVRLFSETDRQLAELGFQRLTRQAM